MTDKRPAQLISKLHAKSEQNDAAILEALAQLEDSKIRGKRKATPGTVSKMTGLALNTVRNRQWALDRLEDIKLAIRNERQASERVKAEELTSTPSALRTRIKRILDQNALLYEEICSLQRIIERKDAEIKALNARKSISVVTAVGGVKE